MNKDEFDLLVQETYTESAKLLIMKGGEYAGSEDRLANFKRGAVLSGCSPLQVALIYLSKHYDAVATYVRDDAGGIDRPRSESIEGRLDDLLNYAILMKALVRESNTLPKGVMKSTYESPSKPTYRTNEVGAHTCLENEDICCNCPPNVCLESDFLKGVK